MSLKKATLSRVLLLLESFSPFLLVLMVIDKASSLYHGSAVFFLTVKKFFSGFVTYQEGSHIFFYFTDFLLIFYCFAIIWGFLVRDKLKAVAVKLHEIFIPAFIFLMLQYGYRFIDHLPQGLHLSLFPVAWEPFFMFLGAVFCFLGLLLSTSALFTLRHSFSIFIEVREVVSGGLYRYIRHPIYFGYIISSIGICLSRPSVAYLIFYLFACELLVYRARLEEKNLALFSPAYRAYMTKTPFLFPLFIPRGLKPRL
jgi:hypothetical protein